MKRWNNTSRRHDADYTLTRKIIDLKFFFNCIVYIFRCIHIRIVLNEMSSIISMMGVQQWQKKKKINNNNSKHETHRDRTTNNIYWAICLHWTQQQTGYKSSRYLVQCFTIVYRYNMFAIILSKVRTTLSVIFKNT